MYVRGGKVWIGKDEQGLVFLEEDWKSDRLPEDLVEEAGLLGTDFKILSKIERAKLAGYSCSGKEIKFTVDPALISKKSENLKVYLAWAGNQWMNNYESKERWLLKYDEEKLLSLNFPLSEFPIQNKFEFKFITSSGLWIDPPDFLPCQNEPIPGSRNYLFSPSRTGMDIIRFKLVNHRANRVLKKWTGFRPENLGSIEEANGYRFRFFAPRAANVTLVIGENNHPEKTNSFIMKMGMDGVWECKIDYKREDLFYFYEVCNYLNTNEKRKFSKRVLDPYAKLCAGREGPAILCKTPRKSRKRVNFIAPDMKDLVVVEAHLRDLLRNAPIKLSDRERQSFNGLRKWLDTKSCYLKELGINAIELQPIQQFDSRSPEEYHWGYMPINFFSPSSDYASSPQKAAQEFNLLIDAFHHAGISVIIDVVYNHYGIPNHLLNIDRELYLSTDHLGRLTNFSGCGNDLQCEAEPVKKLVLDSLKYWVENFEVDGFRFDLGELLGYGLLSEIEDELKKIYPNIILFAEPWSFRGRLPAKMNQTGFALWSDRSRENLLSIVKEDNNFDLIKNIMTGEIDPENQFPWQSVIYSESHDDFAFIDRICSSGENSGIIPSFEEVKKAELAIIISLLSPGIPMLSAGQDFLRSKRGIRNTYLEPEINALDYQRLEKFKNFSCRIRSAISFRLSKRGEFARPRSKNDCVYQTGVVAGKVFSLTITPRNNDEEFLFLCNPCNEILDFKIPESWNAYETILPPMNHLNSSKELKPWHYLLLARKLSP